MSRDALNDTIEFVKMEKHHKERWFDFKKEFKAKKIELLKKHHNERADLCIAELEDIQNNDFTPALIKEYLEKKIALHERQIDECKHLCKQQEQRAKEIHEKNDEERARFKEGL
jgi:hypothetical protein